MTLRRILLAWLFLNLKVCCFLSRNTKGALLWGLLQKLPEAEPLKSLPDGYAERHREALKLEVSQLHSLNARGARLYLYWKERSIVATAWFNASKLFAESIVSDERPSWKSLRASLSVPGTMSLKWSPKKDD